MKDRYIKAKTITSADIHTRGLLFDSLAFRYMKAREAERQLEINEGKTYNTKTNWVRIIDYANKSYQRDVIKFLDLLHEAVGEHD